MRVKTLNFNSTQKPTCLQFIFTTQQINFSLKLKQKNAKNFDVNQLLSIFQKLPTIFDHFSYYFRLRLRLHNK